MSILGYSSAYFLPEYWSNTPLYGEKIIPLLDYILSSDFVQSDKLAGAFYMMQNKYKNTADLPIEAIKEIIEESGYSYILNLLGRDEDSIRLLVYLLVLIHQLKGTKLGLKIVLNLLKREVNPMVLQIIGNPEFNADSGNASNFSNEDYLIYLGLITDQDPFELTFKIKTPNSFINDQCIASSSDKGLYLGINSNAELVLRLGSNGSSWNIVNGKSSVSKLLPNTNYFIKVVFDGSAYYVNVSENGEKYTNFITYESAVTTDIHEGVLYIGVDGSGSETSNSFHGSVNLKPFSVNVDNVTITEWFEQFPIEMAENTFIVKADLDLGVMSADFFEKFYNFTSKYVYPSLAAFEAKLSFVNNLTFLGFNRQVIKYVANGDMYGNKFRVKEIEASGSPMLQYTVKRHSGRTDFEVIPED